MKTKIAVITTFLLLSISTFAQTTLKQYKAGHTFNIGLPDYMSKTIGLNSDASIQYKSVVKDVYGFVIADTKEELTMLEMKFASIDEFYESFIEDFVKGEEKRTVSKPMIQKKGEISFVESDLTYYDKEAKMEIYYLVGIVETKSSYYKVLSWSAVENKDKFKADFQKILYSLKD